MNPLDRTIAELGPEIREGRVSPVALAEEACRRIAAHDGAVKSFVHLSPDAVADAQAAEAEIAEGDWRGPLHGVPVVVKDNYLTRDMPTRAGTDVAEIAFPWIDSEAVRRLREAGAVIMGKTRTHEFAWGTVTPPTANPWDLSRVPGGSSGGTSAAIAAGFGVAGLGSDTGGSIRIPASLCGLVGMKPTFGRVSRAGIVPHTWSLDTAGPLARSVEDAAMLMNVLAGPDAGDPAGAAVPVPDFTEALGRDVSDLSFAVVRNHFFEANQPDVTAAVEQAIADLAAAGMRRLDVDLPNLRYGLGAIFAVELPSATAYHDASIRAGRTAGFKPDVRALVEMGRFVTAVDYLKAEQFRRVLIEDVNRLFEDVDVIIVPTMPLTAWGHDEHMVQVGSRPESALAASWRLTYPFNLTGLPAISIPCGRDRNGLPIGLQIAARAFDEASVLAVADAYERSHDWHRLRAAL